MSSCRKILCFGLVVSVFLLISLGSQVLLAQDNKKPLISTAKTAEVKKIDREIKLDGVLNEPEWQTAKSIGSLRQQEPVENSDPTLKTDVRLLYNKEYLYVGIKCFDKKPDEIIAFQMELDSDPGADDMVGIVLDTFNDKRNAYIFAVSPVGMKFDGIVYNNSEGIDADWDGIWYAEAKQNDTYWTVEIAISFKTLSFNPDIDSWGFNFARNIKRNEELGEMGPSLSGCLLGKSRTGWYDHRP